jgi:glycosyltransferase involved in cell wall biosynthesis
VIDALSAHAFDVCVIHHTRSGALLPEIQGKGIPCVIHAHDVESQFTLAQAQAGLSISDLVNGVKQLLIVEQRVVSRAECVVCVTENDRARLARYRPKRIVVHPLGVDLEHFSWLDRAKPVAATILMTGSLSVAANVEACRWLRHDILPPLRQLLPEATVKIVGRDPGTNVLRLHSPRDGFFVVGPVPDVVESLHRADVFVIPLKRGGGMRMRALEALATGIPVIATSFAVTGIGLEDGKHYLRAETSAAFVRQLSIALRDIPLRSQLSKGGRALVEAHFGWESIISAYERTLVETANQQQTV